MFRCRLEALPSVTTRRDPEDALEFDPPRRWSSVFVEPPPNPQWTAATGTFKAMIARIRSRAGATPASPWPAQAPSAGDSDGQIDVEIDPELLASILHIGPPVPPARRRTPRTPRRSVVAPPPSRRPAHRTHRRRRRRLRSRPAAAAAAHRSAPKPREAPPRTPWRTFTRVPDGAAAAHLWRAGAAVALLVLLAQIVNHYRDQLAATARLHRPLTR